MKPNDLISREALKEAIEEYKYCGFYDKVIELIDNAPTVFSCNACKNMGNELECRDCHDYSNYIHYEERPQGKWIDVPCERDLLFNKGIKYTCSACGKFNSYGHSSFCPNCGADMRKGGAE